LKDGETLSDLVRSEFALHISDLHSLSGLTWSQVSRIFGVSERTVRWWATGYAKTPAIHSKRAKTILQQVVALKAESPAEARTILLQERETTSSIFQCWLDERRVNETVLQYGTFALFKDSLVVDE
jgi:hypothetical protein